MAKLLKHFGFGGKKYNASTNQHSDYSGSTLKSNSVNELVTKNNTKFCSNNYLNGASAATSRKGPSNSKSDYDTRSLKLRNDESTKKSKSSTEKFKGFGKSSKESSQQGSKTLKAHFKAKESDSKSKHKNITFSNLMNSADHHLVTEPSDNMPEVQSSFVPEILEEYSNPLDLTMENDPLTIDDDYSTPYDQVDKFFADANKNVTDNATGNINVKKPKNSVNSRIVSRVVSVKPSASHHTTDSHDNEKNETSNVEGVSPNHNPSEKKIWENNENINQETKALDEDGVRGETNQSYCTSGGSVTVVANKNFDDMQPIIVLNQDALSSSICGDVNKPRSLKPPSNSPLITQTDEKVDCLLRNNCNHASIRPKSDGVLMLSSKKSTSKNQSKPNHRYNIKLKNDKIFNTSNVERKNDGIENTNCSFKNTKNENIETKKKKEESTSKREHNTKGEEDIKEDRWMGVQLKDQDWYHGCISRLEAEQLLSSQSTGTYLVRVSESNKKDFSLSLKSKSGFLHIKIVQDTNSGDYILGQFSQPFIHVSCMVDYYTTNQLPIKGNDGLTLSYPLVSKEHKLV